MKKRFLVFATILISVGCSKQEPRSEKAGEDIAGKMKAPIEATQAIIDKIGTMRDVESDLSK